MNECRERDAVLEIRNLTKHYADFSLDHVNLTLPGGSILGLMGENGAGKSTTIKAVMGLIRPDEGEVRMFGEKAGEDKPALKEYVGLVLEDLHLPDFLNARGIGRMMAGLYKNWDAPLFGRYLERFSIAPGKKLKDYSRGMRMKLAMATALSHGARLLILDEPTSGLDPMAREEALDMLREFVMDETHSVLISSHIISDLEKTADYAAFLHRGRLMLCGEKDRILEQYRIVKGSREEIRALEAEGRFITEGLRENRFGAEALARLADKDAQWDRGRWGISGTPFDIILEPAGLEQIILYLAKGEGRERGAGRGDDGI